MTWREICDRLRESGVDTPEWDAELLLEHFCGVSSAAIVSNPDADYPDAALADAVMRRADRYPLQYLLGEWQFYRQTYEVSPDCLIPRADTELIVETAIRLLPPNACFADLCTGSGCIAISTLAERPDTRALALEKFPRTLELAVRNAARNGVSERFTPHLADLFDDNAIPSDRTFDAILSNPPYIRPDVIARLEPELAAEPIAALDGGTDGLDFYRRILALAPDCLAPHGFVLFEIGYDQAAALTSLAPAYGFCVESVLQDLGGCDRAVLLRRKEALRG